MTQRIVVSASATTSALAWWRVRLGPAGPGGSVTVALAPGVRARVDRVDPTHILDLETVDADRDDEFGARGLVEAVWGGTIAASIGEHATVEVWSRDDSFHRRLSRVLALDVLVSRLPAVCSSDVAREAMAVAEVCPSEAAAAMLRRWAYARAARAAHASHQLPAAAAWGPEAEAALMEADSTIAAVLGGPRALASSVPHEDHPEPWDQWVSESPTGELTTSRGAGRGEPDDGEPVELVTTHLGILIEEARLTAVERMVTLHGHWRLRGTKESSESEMPTAPPPATWARAFTSGGSLLYVARCRFDDDTFAADLVVAGDHPEDYVLDLCHDLAEESRAGSSSAAAQARMRAIAAANLQIDAQDEESWATAAGLWERSADLWGTAGDRARRTLALVQALRAYRSAGERFVDRVDSLEHRATVALTQLDPTWRVPDAGTRAVSDPHELGALLRTAALAGPVTEWVRTQLDDLTTDIRGNREGAAGPRNWERRLDALQAAAGGSPSSVSAQMAARVALARWAAGSGRRRLAHLILFPLAVRYGDLDDTARRELAETQILLIAAPWQQDPDEPA